MQTLMTLEEAYSILKARYGSHVAAARAMKLNPTHYRKLRNGLVSMPKNRCEYFLLKAREVSAEMQDA